MKNMRGIKKFMRYNLREDKKAKSKTYFFKKKLLAFDDKFINFLEKKYHQSKKNIRICLHTNIKDNHHDMVLLQQRKDFYSPWINNNKMGNYPHKHIKKEETFHLIKGKMACGIFNNKGEIKFVCLLKKNSIFKISKNIYHTLIPISKHVIYHESTLGKMPKKGDVKYAPWISKYNNKKKILEFQKNFRKFFS